MFELTLLLVLLPLYVACLSLAWSCRIISVFSRPDLWFIDVPGTDQLSLPGVRHLVASGVLYLWIVRLEKVAVAPCDYRPFSPLSPRKDNKSYMPIFVVAGSIISCAS